MGRISARPHLVRRVFSAVFAAALLLLAHTAHAQVPPAAWTAKCNTCHGTPPASPRVNGAASTSVVNAAIANNAVTTMGSITFAVGELAAIVNYLNAVFSPGFVSAINTPANVAGTVNLTGNDVVLNTAATALNVLETASGPGVAGATVSYNTGTPSITYTPANCYVGSDSFTYRARNTSLGTVTSNRTISVTVGNPVSAPVLTPGSPPAGTTGIVYPGFTVVATNCPTSFSAINMPPGLTINNAGVVSGTPTTAGTFNATITATNAGGLMGSQPYTFNIALGAPVITSGGASGAVGIAFTPYQITATNGPPFTAIGATGLPPGLNVSPTGLITGTPTASGNFPVTLSAQNAAGTGTAIVTFAIAVGVPVVNSPPTASGQTLVPFSYQITATNGPTSFTAAPLPPGLNLVAGGMITGTPTTVGSTVVTVTATNGTGTSTPFTLTINVTLGPPQITSPTTANGGFGVAFSYQITATNNPTSFNATGLPAGLGVNTTTGLISGTPTVGGTFNVTLSATNNVPLTGTQGLTLTIALSAPVVTSTGPFNGQTGVPATFQLTATNGPTSFAAAPLPPGLNLNATTGQITGTPTAVGSTVASVTATNGAGTSPAVNVTFNITLGPPTITSPTTAGGSQGVPFTYQITALNNPTSFNATGLPPGLAVNTATGLISGTPTTNGTFPGSVSATNATATSSQAVTFTIAFGSPVITSPATAGGSTGQPFTYQITATNNPTSFNATGLPPGLFVNTASGLISGTPGASGTFNVTLSATNGSGTGTRALTISIGLSAPVITSPNAVSGTTDTAINYQIQATNFPTSFAATGLPPGVNVDTASGAITGTPTNGGTFNATISATNGAGTGSAPLTFTIAFVAPVVKDIAVTVPFQTATAINLPITGTFTRINIVTMPEHGILSTPVPGVPTITYTPAIGFSGEDVFTYTVTGPGGTSAVAMVTITVPNFKPVVDAVTMTVDLNTPKTLDLRPFITGSGVTGVSIPKAASHGTVTVDGTKVTYTPKNNYFGPDTFSYIAFGNAGTSSPGVVTVNVIGRPDPTKDPNVVSLLDTQQQTAKRFSRAQISNYQRRLESMHVPPAPVASAPEPVTPPDADKEKKAQSAPPAAIVPLGTPSLGPATAQGPQGAARQVNPLPAALTSTLVGAATSNSMNLALSTDGGGSAKALSTNVWIGGMANFGRRGATDDASSAQFSTDGVTIGVDRRVNDRLALGIGIGYAQDRTEFGGDGSKSKADGTSFAGYGSYHPTGNTFVDWMLGYGVINYDSDRYVASVEQFATGQRKGRQLFGSLAAGYERRWMDMLLSPYGRLDFSFDKLRQSTETGAGLNALTFLDQTQRTTSLAAGLRVESRHEADFGIVAPRARVEYRHDFESGRNASIQYADGFAGLTYSVTPTGTSRNFLVLGLGVDFMLRRGLSFGIDYQGQRSSGAASAQAIRFQLTQELDGPGLPNIGWTSLPFANPIRVEGGFTFDDNVSRGREANEKLSDRIYSLNVGMDKVFFPSKYTKATATALLSVDKFHTYTGLGRGSIGAQGELQYRASGEFDANTYGITGRALYDKFESDLRTGSHYSLGLNIRRSLTDRIDLFGEVARNVRYGKSDVFDLKDTAAKFNVDYSLGMSGAFYFAGEYRKGDLFSSGRSSLVSLALADVFVVDDAFPGGDFFAYRLKGKSWLGTVGFNYPLGPRDAIDFSYRRVQSTPDGRPNFDFAGKLRYIDNQYSIVYLMRF